MCVCVCNIINRERRGEEREREREALGRSRPPVEYADQEAQPGVVKVVKSMEVEVWGPEAPPEEEEGAGSERAHKRTRAHHLRTQTHARAPPAHTNARAV